MSASDESRFPAIASLPCYVVRCFGVSFNPLPLYSESHTIQMFLGCPHQCRTIPALQQGLERLVQGLPSIAGVPVTLTTSLANLVITINDEFLNANINLDISISNILSIHSDEGLRVCRTSSGLHPNTPMVIANCHRCSTLTKRLFL